jgi:dipeptidase
MAADAKHSPSESFYVLSTMAPSLKLTHDVDELPFSVKPDKKVSVSDVFAYYRQTYEGTEFDATKNLLVRDTRRRPGDQAVTDNTYDEEWWQTHIWVQT